MEDFALLITSPRFRGLISAVAAVVMYFTPDHIDRIIEGLLGAFGITDLVIPTRKRHQ